MFSKWIQGYVRDQINSSRSYPGQKEKIKFSSVSTADFEEINVSWVGSL